jgi:hypothetical protein
MFTAPAKKKKEKKRSNLALDAETIRQLLVTLCIRAGFDCKL